ncbi:MAG: MlaD family protein [Sulfurimonas sp.]
MNNKVNYTLVGFIVLAVFAVFATFSYWMLKPTQSDEMQRYVIYFDESVYGLNLDAPVKFRGIRVGTVANLRINPHNSEQVEVQVSIYKDTPIKENIVAVLTAQGITGLTYINLTVGDKYIDKTVDIDGNEYHIIATAPSIFKNFERSFGNVSEHLTGSLYQTEKLLSDQNQKEFVKLMQSWRRVGDKVDRSLDEETIKHFQSSMANLDGAIASIDTLAQKTLVWEKGVAQSLHQITRSYKKIDASMTTFKGAVDRGDFNLKEISSELVPNLNNTLIELQEMMLQFESTFKEYERSPSDILFKREAIKKAPGE